MLEHSLAEQTDTSLETLLARYREALSAAIESNPTAVEDDIIAAIEAGAIESLAIETVARILALERDRDQQALLQGARDELLFGMTTAVLDVDALAQKVEADLTPGELQRAIEGRDSMTLETYCRIRLALADAGA